MVISCAALGCRKKQNSLDDNGNKISFHRFPRNKDLCQAWLVASKREDFVPSRFSYLCSEHFTDDQFNRTINPNSSRLKPNAVPTVFKGFTSLRKKNPLKAAPGDQLSIKTSPKQIYDVQNHVKIAPKPQPILISDVTTGMISPSNIVSDLNSFKHSLSPAMPPEQGNGTPVSIYIVHPQADGTSIVTIPSPGSLNLAGLTTANLGNISTANLGAIPTANLGAIPTANLGAIPTANLGAIPTANLGTLSTANLGTLSAANLGTLTAANLGTLTAANLGTLTAANLGTLTAANLGTLSNGNFGTIRTAVNGGFVSGLGSHSSMSENFESSEEEDSLLTEKEKADLKKCKHRLRICQKEIKSFQQRNRRQKRKIDKLQETIKQLRNPDFTEEEEDFSEDISEEEIFAELLKRQPESESENSDEYDV